MSLPPARPFPTDRESIPQIVRQHPGHVDYAAEPQALEYRQSQSISDQDADFIETVYNAAADHDEDNPLAAED